MTVRQARPEEWDHLAGVLARAFADDPLQEWMVPPERNRARRIEPMFRVEVRSLGRRGEVWTTDDLAGAAVWAAPTQWKSDWRDALGSTLPALLCFRHRLPRALRLITAMEKAHPTEPHWYLGILGADPDHRGRGVGGALLDAVLSRCDERGEAAYLESSKVANVAYYERFGFRVIDELRVESGAPPVPLMWRDPA